jgi:uncharacterized protein (TIGR00369 family)
MQQDRSIALARLREELKRPPFHALLRPRAIDADPDGGTVTIVLDYRDELARAPHDKSFHGGVIATLIDLTGHAAVAVKIGKMAPTIDLRIDYLRPSTGESIVARARLLKVGRMLARVDRRHRYAWTPLLRWVAGASAQPQSRPETEHGYCWTFGARA